MNPVLELVLSVYRSNHNSNVECTLLEVVVEVVVVDIIVVRNHSDIENEMMT